MTTPALDRRVHTISTLDALGVGELDALTAGRSFYVSRPWLKAVELQHAGHTAYLSYRDSDGVLRGICPVYWGESSSRGYYDPYEHFLRRSGAEFNREDWWPSCMMGSRAAYNCEFLIDPTSPPSEQRDVLALLLDAATEHAHGVGAASLSALYLNPRGTAQLREVLADDQVFYLAGANSVLDVRWSSMEDYLQSLGGSRGRNIRREMRVFGAQGYTIDGGRLSDWLDVAADLFAQLERRYGHDATAAAEAAELHALATCADEYSRILAIRDGGRVIGIMLFFVWEGVVYGRSAGFDYPATRQAFEYFNLAYYETIRFAIEHGCRRVEFGMATYRAKLARGARLEPLFGLSLSRRADSPLSNAIFASWDHARRNAVRTEDPSLLERAQVP